jgi:RND family efflux transporter MFP subunit
VLAGRKSATPQELDEATATLRGAEARTTRAAASVEEARAALDAARAGGEAAEVGASFTRVTAPFDGLVTEKLVEPGNLAVPGTPLLRIEDTSGFKLEVRIDESRAAWVSRHAGVPVTVDAPTGPRTVAGRVDEVARAIDADARALLVTIALPPADDLRAGMFGRASIPGPVRRTLTVPDEALVRHGQLSSVFVVDNGRARMRLVNAGRSQAARVEVLAGLAEGERVVVGPPAGLRDGAALVDGPAGAREGGRS